MKQALKFLLLLLHVMLFTVMVYYGGDFISQKVNILLVLTGVVVWAAMIITLVLHTSEFISSFKNKTNQL